MCAGVEQDWLKKRMQDAGLNYQDLCKVQPPLNKPPSLKWVDNIADIILENPGTSFTSPDQSSWKILKGYIREWATKNYRKKGRDVINSQITKLEDGIRMNLFRPELTSKRFAHDEKTEKLWEYQMRNGVLACHVLDSHGVEFDDIWSFYYSFVMTTFDRDRITKDTWSASNFARTDKPLHGGSREDFTDAAKSNLKTIIRNTGNRTLNLHLYTSLLDTTPDKKPKVPSLYYSILHLFANECVKVSGRKVVIIPPEAVVTASYITPTTTIVTSLVPPIPEDWEIMIWVVSIFSDNPNWKKARFSNDLDNTPDGATHCIVYFLHRAWTHVLFCESNQWFKIGQNIIKNPSESSQLFGMDIGEKICNYINDRYKVPPFAEAPLEELKGKASDAYKVWGTLAPAIVGRDPGHCVICVAKCIWIAIIVYPSLFTDSKDLPFYSKAQAGTNGEFDLQERTKFFGYLRGLTLQTAQESSHFKPREKELWDEYFKIYRRSFPNNFLSDGKLKPPGRNLFCKR